MCVCVCVCIYVCMYLSFYLYTYTYIYVYVCIYIERANTSNVNPHPSERLRGPHLGLYKIVPWPLLYGMYCNKGWSGGNTVLHKSVGDEGGEWGGVPK